jgi:hypothetical protein
MAPAPLMEVMQDFQVAILLMDTQIAFFRSLLLPLAALRAVEELEVSVILQGIRELWVAAVQEVILAFQEEVEEDTTVVGEEEQALPGQAAQATAIRLFVFPLPTQLRPHTAMDHWR